MKVGFIGTGNMGGPMAANVLAAGNELCVYDANRSATATLEEAGAVRCEDIASLVRACEVVLLSLPGPTEVDAVAAEVLESMSAGQTLVDMSTNSPAVVKRIAALAQTKGVGFLDAPVSGGVRGAKKATLAIMVGGDKSLYDRLAPLFGSMGANIFHVGDVGAGNVAKLVNNMLAFSTMMSNAEALILGAKAGVDLNVLWNIVRTSSGGSMTWEGGGKAILRDRLAPSFTVDLACKDIGLATDLAREVGVDLTMIPTAERLLKNFQANGFAKEDVLATVKALEEAAGVTVRGTWDQ
ncbi:MAG: 3-hydroxyisobutyrate dehydrogenase-like beta-hydroxyacid dehydrogenase [Gammaproteobacteria bacterium]|jgi:3-hydroxyisobutyrate dehydrogenase-like beta-hydroxyacid dehydrogenase